MKLTKEQNQILFDPEEAGNHKVFEENGTTCICEGNGNLTWTSEQIHPVYRIESAQGIQYIAQRDIPETKIVNFRDLGGYPAKDGRQVRYHQFYRCAPVVVQDEDSRQVLEALQLKTIMDFRSEEEAEQQPDSKLAGCTNIQIGAIAKQNGGFNGNFDFKDLMMKADVESLKEYMQSTYANLPFDNEAYRVMFQRILTNEVPLAFHCTAGKDRTGVGAYLILKTLGVADDVILEDYLASNIYRKEENEQLCKRAKGMEDVVMALMMVYPQYLQTTMDAIAKRYPDFETYLLEEYNISKQDIETLRLRYLYETK